MRHIWRIGPAPLTVATSASHAPLLNCLGDTAVDFDIAPPRVAPETRSNAEDFRTNTFLINVSLFFVKY